MDEQQLRAIGKSFDYLGKSRRQRKTRIIEVDDREDRDGVVGLILSGLGYTVQRGRLPLGDYRWESKLGLVLVERKTPADLRSSLLPTAGVESGAGETRLLSQLRRLRDARNGGSTLGEKSGTSGDGEERRDVGVGRSRYDSQVFPILLIDHRSSREDPFRATDLDNILLSLGGRVRIAHCQQGQLAHRLDSLFTWSNKSSHALLDTAV